MIDLYLLFGLIEFDLTSFVAVKKKLKYLIIFNHNIDVQIVFLVVFFYFIKICYCMGSNTKL